MDIIKILEAESRLIDGMFKRNNIYAKVDPEKSIYKDAAAGFIRYGLRLRADQHFDKVERLQRELSAALGRQREQMRIAGQLNVIPVSAPSFALEVPHPAPATLLWSGRTLSQAPAHTLIIGRSYGEIAKDETINFGDANGCHVLVAGITGSGKSILMQHMLLSLCAGTSPEELKIVLVDLKNEDLLPFRALPHVLTFAGTREEAVNAIGYVAAEKEKRVAQAGYKPFRLVLVIDEMAQLASLRGVADTLGDLASIGRSKGINLIGATQHPTEKGGLGSLLKANFPVRLVGMVAPGQSYAATGRAKTFADLLPGKGAFLRCQGPQVQRFQSYFIETEDVELMTRKIANHWKASGYATGYGDGAGVVTAGYGAVIQPVITGYQAGYERLHTSTIIAQPVTGYGLEKFPLKAARALSESEAQTVRRLAESGNFDYNGKLSLNRVVMHVYGSKDPARLVWVKDAIEGANV